LEYEDDDIYVPKNPSENPCLIECLYKSLSLLTGIDYNKINQIRLILNWFMLNQKITKGVISVTKIGILNEMLKEHKICISNIKLNGKLSNGKNTYTTSKTSKNDKDSHIVAVFCYNNHYSLVKNIKKITKNVEKIMEKCVKFDMNITQVKEKKIEHYKQWIQPINIEEQLNNICVYDTETYTDKNGVFKCFAAGYINFNDTVNGKDIEEEDWKYVKIYYGDNNEETSPLYEMFDELDNNTEKIKYESKGQILEWKQVFWFFAHNGKGFDSYILMNDKLLSNKVNFKSIVKTGAGILLLQFEMKNIKVNLQCTLAHLSGSLKSLCKSFKVPNSISKDDFDVTQINSENYLDEDLKQKCIYYLQNDVLSLANIWKKQLNNYEIAIQTLKDNFWTTEMNQQNKNKTIKIVKALSSAGASWNIYSYIFNKDISVNKIGNFENWILKQYLRKSIHGGWVAAYINKFDFDNDNEELHDFDANSLYGSVMQDKNIEFPDINSFEILNSTDIKEVLKYKFYIINCDIYIPKEMKFIPVCVKYANKTGCYYSTGYHKN